MAVFTGPGDRFSQSCMRSCIACTPGRKPAGANIGVEWLTIVARPRRLAVVASPRLSMMYGYTFGRSASASSGSSCTDSPRSLPADHSTVPWVPTCTTALAPNCVRSHR